MNEPDVFIEEISGNCPVQGTGTIDYYGFYFRARGAYWSVEVYHGEKEPWEYGEDYGSWPDAGWMPLEEAQQFIIKAAKKFHNRPELSYVKKLEAALREIACNGSDDCAAAICRLALEGKDETV